MLGPRVLEFPRNAAHRQDTVTNCLLHEDRLTRTLHTKGEASCAITLHNMQTKATGQTSGLVN